MPDRLPSSPPNALLHPGALDAERHGKAAPPTPSSPPDEYDKYDISRLACTE